MMVAELLGEAPEDAETVVISWMRPLRPKATSNDRQPNDVYPFTLVTSEMPPQENVELGTLDVVIHVRTLCNKNLGGPGKGWVAARDEKDRTHRRMLLLIRELEDVPMAGGRNATVDYASVFSGQVRQKWDDDQVICYVGRYKIGLSYVQVP
jgi:hypothetical protein